MEKSGSQRRKQTIWTKMTIWTKTQGLKWQFTLHSNIASKDIQDKYMKPKSHSIYKHLGN
ncbi:hypothetical protein HanXRQr2_Chr04g0167041 [Helianthus annuus]|uniref:Uncharacterized protein n=1 Tax=Helianthus annuus TaxID=4232 RepID=A0A9K3NSY0_HELAN|nr:hypothetical protein HanXRQr2_Chr04g0167041 [Helianthus annuus]